MNNINTPPKPDPVRDRIMRAIKMGDAHMRPRWHFVLISFLFALGVSCAFLVLLYIASLSVFLLRESGVWFVPSFGLRGWFAFARSIPISHIILIILFIFILEALIRRYSVVYRRPLIGSFIVVAAVIMLGGILIGQTPLHKKIALYAREHRLPPLFDLPYGTSTRVALPPDLYEGTVVAKENDVLVIEHLSDGDSDIDDGHRVGMQGTTTANETNQDSYGRWKKRTRIVIITSHTRLPHKQDFEIGSRVVVQGDDIGTSTVEAFGIRDIDD